MSVREVTPVAELAWVAMEDTALITHRLIMVRMRIRIVIIMGIIMDMRREGIPRVRVVMVEAIMRMGTVGVGMVV